MAVNTFKVTETEARQIRRLAKREHTTVSAYLRRKALDAPAETVTEIVYAKCPVTGAKIFGHNPALPPLTTESVKAMLTDFP